MLSDEGAENAKKQDEPLAAEWGSKGFVEDE